MKHRNQASDRSVAETGSEASAVTAVDWIISFPAPKGD
jgi:hypothetical protein